MIYECNGCRTHIAIIYESQPCPLCACLESIKHRECDLKSLIGAADEAMDEHGPCDCGDWHASACCSFCRLKMLVSKMKSELEDDERERGVDT